MAINFTQTSAVADSGANVGCSGQTLASTPNTREIVSGGTAGSVELTFDITNNATRASMMFQTNVGTEFATTWPSGDYVVRLNVSTASTDVQWVATYICERTSGGSYNTVASLTGQTTSMGTTGVKTHTVNRATNYAAVSGSTLYIVCVFTNSDLENTRSIGIIPNQDIDTPLNVGEGVSDGFDLGVDITTSVREFVDVEGIELGDSARTGIADGLNLGEDITTSLGQVFDTEGVVFSEDIDTVTTYEDSGDGVALSDAASSSVGKGVSDGIDLSDDESTQWDTLEALSDGVDVGIDITTSIREFTDIEGIELGDTSFAGNQEEITEGLDLGEDITTSLGQNFSNEGIAVSDTASYPDNPSVSDGVVLSEDIDTVTTYEDSGDGISLGDAVTTDASASIVDGVELSDVEDGTVGTTGGVSDGLDLAENLIITVEQDTGPEGISLGDAASVDAVVPVEDGLEFGDALAAYTGYNDSLTEGVEFVLDITTSVRENTNEEGISLSDQSGYEDTGRSEIDGISLGDAAVYPEPELGSVTDGVVFSEDFALTIITDDGPDGVSLGDSPTLLTAFLGTETDGIELYDLAQVSGETVASDGLALGEDITTSLGQEFDTEGVVLGDTTVYATSETGSVSEGIDLGEDIDTLVTNNQEDETLVLGDAPTSSIAFLGTEADGVELSDLVQVDGDASVSDGVVTGEDIDTVTTFNDTGDGVELSDAAIYSEVETGSVTDSLIASETIDISLVSQDDAVEGITLYDNAAYPPDGPEESVEDTLLAGDLLSLSAGLGVVDAILVSDTPESLLEAVSGLSEEIRLGDISEYSGAAVKFLSESVELGDGAATIWETHEDLADGISSEDSLDTSVGTGLSNGITLADNLNLLVALLEQEGVSMGDAVHPGVSLLQSSSLLVSDSVNSRQDYLSSLISGAVFSDEVLRGDQINVSVGALLGDLLVSSKQIHASSSVGAYFGDTASGYRIPAEGYADILEFTTYILRSMDLSTKIKRSSDFEVDL